MQPAVYLYSTVMLQNYCVALNNVSAKNEIILRKRKGDSPQPQAIDEKLVFGYPVLPLLVECPRTASGWGKPQTMATRHASAPTNALFIVLLYI